MRKKKLLSLILIFCCIFMMTGCCDKVITSYSDNPKIKTEHTSENKVARITITDSYTKSGIKYYIFTTNVSGTRKFILSEKEYDEYIGLENDAVDCTIYYLSLQSEVCKYKYWLISKYKLPYNRGFGENYFYYLDDLLGNTPEIIEKTSYQIKKAYDSSGNEVIFNEDYPEYKILMDSNPEVDKEQINASMNLYRYSFVGENDFSKDDIAQYTDVMENVNKGICREINSIIEK